MSKTKKLSSAKHSALLLSFPARHSSSHYRGMSWSCHLHAHLCLSPINAPLISLYLSLFQRCLPSAVTYLIFLFPFRALQFPPYLDLSQHQNGSRTLRTYTMDISYTCIIIHRLWCIVRCSTSKSLLSNFLTGYDKFFFSVGPLLYRILNCLLFLISSDIPWHSFVCYPSSYSPHDACVAAGSWSFHFWAGAWINHRNDLH